MGFGFGNLMVLGGAGPWVVAHFHLEQWAQRREKQKMTLSLEAIPEIETARRPETMVSRKKIGEGLSWGVQEVSMPVL